MWVIGFGICSLFSFLFVSLLYVSSRGRGDRDADDVIRVRLVSVGVSCLLVGGLTRLWLGDTWTFVEYTGLSWWLPLRAYVIPLALTVLLFLGPLVQMWGEQDYEWPPSWSSLIWWRNTVWAPLAEEWVFRGCMVAVLYRQGWGYISCLLVPPLFFGVAHSHHVFTIVRDRGRSGRVFFPFSSVFN